MNDNKISNELLEGVLKHTALIYAEDIADEDYPSHEFSYEFQKNMESLIKLDLKTQRKKLVSKKFSKVGRIAAIIAMIITSVVTACAMTILSVEALRTNFFTLLVDKGELYSNLRLIDKNNPDSSQTYFETKKQPAYMPPGFIIYKMSEGGEGLVVTYRNNTSRKEISYQLLPGAGTINIDTEDSTSKLFTINGEEAILYQKGDRLILVFVVDDFIGLLIGEVEEQELILMAQNVK